LRADRVGAVLNLSIAQIISGMTFIIVLYFLNNRPIYKKRGA
jgi:hypothetical protein